MKHLLFRSIRILAIAIIAGIFIQPTGANAQVLTKEKIQAALDEAYTKFKDLKEGKNADYIKELATVDPNIYGIAIVTTDGQVYTKGDLKSAVSIQSISKVFTSRSMARNMAGIVFSGINPRHPLCPCLSTF